MVTRIGLLLLIGTLVTGCVTETKDGASPRSRKMTTAPHEFRQTLFIAAPADRVWAAIVTPADVKQYYLCPLETIELKSGGRIVYGSDGQTLISGTVLQATPGYRLVHTFRFAPDTHASTDKDAESRVTYAIKPMGAICELTLTHDEFGSDNRTYANVTGGWPSILSGLKTYVETGKPLPWPTSGNQVGKTP
jgi:uncharacterized protein YndB with AHSA1/START domain